MTKENTATPPDNALKDRKKFLISKWVETAAILPGVTTLLSALASWIGSLHSGIQSINFTKSNNMASEGNAECYTIADRL